MSDPMDQIERIEAVDIHPGDTIVVYLKHSSLYIVAADIHRQMRRFWPDNQIVILKGVDHIEVQRPGGDDGDALGTVDAEGPGEEVPPQGEGAGRAAP